MDIKQIVLIILCSLTIYGCGKDEEPIVEETLVSTLAGSGSLGFKDGKGTTAEFKLPRGITVARDGKIYVSDDGNNSIRKVTAEGEVTTLAGNGIIGFVDGNGATAKFFGVSGITTDAAGNIYVADVGNNSIRKITASGEVTTLAGAGRFGFKDGNATDSEFAGPNGVAVDANNNVYVADTGNHCIRKISAAGEVTTLAGNGKEGFADGTGADAQFNLPFGMTIDAKGNLYVTDSNNHRIRKINLTGEVTTIAGSGVAGFADGSASSAQFSGPFGIAIDITGKLYVSDFQNQRIRMISATGDVSTLAGSGVQGFVDGKTAEAQFHSPTGIAVDAVGAIYVADEMNNCIRKISR